MKSFLIISASLFFLFSCKKKENAPEPIKPDEVTYQTDFTDQSWNTHTTTKSVSSYESGSFKIAVDTVRWVAYELAPYIDQLDYTYMIQADVTISLDDPNQLGHAGFVYNYIDTANHCFMNICTNGTFYAFQRKSSQNTTLYYNTVSKDLKKGSGQTNTIAIRQYDTFQEIIFNGISQGSLPFIKERGYTRVGLCTLCDYPYYTPVSTKFDNFVLKKIY